MTNLRKSVGLENIGLMSISQVFQKCEKFDSITKTQVDRAQMLVKANHPLVDTPITKVLPFLKPLESCLPKENAVRKMMNANTGDEEVHQAIKDEE